MGFQMMIHGFYVGAGRRHISKAILSSKSKELSQLREDHKKAFGTDKLPDGLYPDMGTGRYTALLDYADWFRFASLQRAHLNYTESIALALLTLLVSGVFFPGIATALGASYIVGREMYAWQYALYGPNYRIAGVAILDLALLAQLGFAVYGSLLHSGVIASA